MLFLNLPLQIPEQLVNVNLYDVNVVVCYSILNKLFPINFNSLTNIKGGFGVHISKGWGRGQAGSKVKGEREEGGWLYCSAGEKKKVKYVLITLL